MRKKKERKKEGKKERKHERENEITNETKRQRTIERNSIMLNYTVQEVVTHIYRVSYCLNWVKTSWTYRIFSEIRIKL